MHNRARLITAHFLTRILEIDWRAGYRHFFALLADGDVASNAGNWQWVAGTGNNPRPGQTMNMLRQARRFAKLSGTKGQPPRTCRALGIIRGHRNHAIGVFN